MVYTPDLKEWKFLQRFKKKPQFIVIEFDFLQNYISNHCLLMIKIMTDNVFETTDYIVRERKFSKKTFWKAFYPKHIRTIDIKNFFAYLKISQDATNERIH